MIFKYCGVTFEVEYHAYKGYEGSFEQPPEPAEFWIESASIDGVNVYEWLTDAVIDDMESQLIDYLKTQEDDYV